MNPVVKPVDDKHVIYELTNEDRAKLKRFKLVMGSAELYDIALHRVCVMQAVAMVTNQADLIKDEDLALIRKYESDSRLSGAELGQYNKIEIEFQIYTDEPICVSATITDYLIHLNDWHKLSDRQRVELKKVIPEILNTCPVARTTKSVRTKGTPHGWGHVTVEIRDDKDEAYKQAERERRVILDRIPPDTVGVALRKKLDLVREAAAVLVIGKDN